MEAMLHKRANWSLTCCGVVAALIASLCSTHAAFAQTASAEKLLNDWRDKVPGDGFRATWTQVTRGDAKYLPTVGQRQPGNNDASSEMFEETLRLSCWSDGKRFGYFCEGDRAMLAGNQIVYRSYHYRATFDRKIGKSLFAKQLDEPPKGFVRDATKSSAASITLDIKPPMWAMSPFVQNFTSWDLDRLEVVNTTPLGDAQCYVCRLPLNWSTADTLWLDTQEFVIRRVSLGRRSGGGAFAQIDIKYGEPSGVRERLSVQSWTTTRYRGPEVIAVTTAKDVILDYDAEFENSDFDIKFPAGTLVLDTHKPNVPDPDFGYNYIVREDGSEREILKSEYLAGADYAQLLYTITSEALAQPSDK